MITLGADNKNMEELINGKKEINIAKIRDKKDLDNIPKEMLYDETQPIVDLKLRDGLSEEEIEDALGYEHQVGKRVERWSGWKNYARGIMLLTGDEGGGKTMAMHMIGFKLNYYFNLMAVTDTRPRELFDLYSRHIPFSEEFLVEQADRIWEVANMRLKPDKQRDPNMPVIQPHIRENGQWVGSTGDVLLQNAVVMLDEFGKKYMNRSEPNNPIHRDLKAKILPDWRHLNSLIIGATPMIEMIDPVCDNKITCVAYCSRAIGYDEKGNIKPDSLVFKIHLKSRRSITPLGEYNYAPKDDIIYIDANRPIPMLNGATWKDIYNHRQAVAFEMANSIKKKYKKQAQ